VSRTVAELGSIDSLVNMASEFHPKAFDELQPSDFDDAIASNLKAPYLTAVAAARAMRRQPIVDGLQGKIINFADWAVERPYKNFLPYFIAKGGVVTMTRALAVELAPTIAVNAIAPAMIDPPPSLSPADIEEIRQASLLKRLGTPSDANNLVLYLLEGTDFVTGAVYRVDGGRFFGVD
jgi:NAD(P)-dependent dehydrogenase (short-subunit alcohol dehydrogenase family)